MLLLCAFVGRAYCRFVCPYGALLGLFSRAASTRISITPDVCIDCGLCHDACPFGAIRAPAAGRKRPTIDRRLLRLLWLLPVLAAFSGALAGPLLVRRDTDVVLARMLGRRQRGELSSDTVELEAYRRLGWVDAAVVRSAELAVTRARAGGLLLGAFIGLVVVVRALRALGARDPCDEYEADPSECVACGRCFEYCPRERVRLGETISPAGNQGGEGSE